MAEEVLQNLNRQWAEWRANSALPFKVKFLKIYKDDMCMLETMRYVMEKGPTGNSNF
jgi:hypothetical protein